jgi:sensor histidine kinase regulating citrate/malate metabolism
MINLCTNTSQAMEETGGIMETKVENVILEERTTDNYIDLPADDYIKITARDIGPGISSKIISRIFNPYFATKEMGKGIGQGTIDCSWHCKKLQYSWFDKKERLIKFKYSFPPLECKILDKGCGEVSFCSVW